MRIDIRGREVEVTDRIRAHAERSLRLALGRFEEKIEHVTIHLLDLNGPRGGFDKCCQIRVLFSGGSVFVAEAASNFHRALDRAIGRAGRTVRRKLERQKSAGMNVRGTENVPLFPQPQPSREA